jgi:hypothetical protein
VFENRVLRRTFGHNSEELTGNWRTLHNEELHNLYTSLNIILKIRLKRVSWAGYVERMGNEKCLLNFGLKA